jgi:hypothetical protein
MGLSGQESGFRQQRNRIAREQAQQQQQQTQTISDLQSQVRALQTERAPLTTEEQIASELPEVKTERLGAPEEQAARSILARQLMEQQQAAQRQLASQQARSGVRGGAAAAQQARLARQLEAERASQEQAAFLGQRQFNIQQAQREQFANLAAELARRQIQAGLRGQTLMSQAAKEYGQAQLAASQQGGKVICAELGRQGYLDAKTLKADAEFGRMIYLVEPEVMHGYWKLALPVVGLMKKSKAFTWAVSLIAKPWARYMAYMMGASEKGSFFGMIIHTVGKPVCRAFGKKVIVYG